VRKIFLTSLLLAAVLVANPSFAKQTQRTHKTKHAKHQHHKKALPPATGTPAR
jgi:hypothetical protein